MNPCCFCCSSCVVEMFRFLSLMLLSVQLQDIFVCGKAILTSDQTWRSYKELHAANYLKLVKLQKMKLINFKSVDHIEIKVEYVVDENLFMSFGNSTAKTRDYLTTISRTLNENVFSFKINATLWNGKVFRMSSSTSASRPLTTSSIFLLSLMTPSTMFSSSPPPSSSSSSSSSLSFFCQDLLTTLLRRKLEQLEAVDNNSRCVDLACVWVYIGSKLKACDGVAVPDSFCTKRAVIFLSSDNDGPRSDLTGTSSRLGTSILKVLGLSRDESLLGSVETSLVDKLDSPLLWWCQGDRSNGSSGNDEWNLFSSQFLQNPPFHQECGNGVVERGEQCDCGDVNSDAAGKGICMESEKCCDVETCMFVSCRQIAECCQICKTQEPSDSPSHLHLFSTCPCQDFVISSNDCQLFDRWHYGSSGEFTITTADSTRTVFDGEEKIQGNLRREESVKANTTHGFEASLPTSPLHPPMTLHTAPSSFVSSSLMSLSPAFVIVCVVFSAAFIVYFIQYNRRTQKPLQTSKALWPKRPIDRKRRGRNQSGGVLKWGTDGDDMMMNLSSVARKKTLVSFGNMPSYRDYKFQVRFGIEPATSTAESCDTAEEIEKDAFPKGLLHDQLLVRPAKSILKNSTR